MSAAQAGEESARLGAGRGVARRKISTGGPPGRISLSPVAWRGAEGLRLEEWTEQGRRLGVMGRSVGWWIGDWLLFGNLAYGERYARAARITGYDVQTLMNMVYVASRFEISRRREALSWSHHAELAALPPTAQDRWLDRAEADRLSVRCLREALRTDRRAGRRQEMTSDKEVGTLGAATDDDVTCPACGHAFTALHD